MTLSKGQKLQITDCFVRASFENATQKGVPWLKLMLQDPSNPDGDSVEAKCFEPEVISTLLGQAGVSTYAELKGKKVSFNGEWDIYNEKGSWKIKSAIKQNPIMATPDTQGELTEAELDPQEGAQLKAQPKALSKAEWEEKREFEITYGQVFNNAVLTNCYASGKLVIAEERAKHFDPTIFASGAEVYIPNLFEVFINSKELMRQVYEQVKEEARQAEEGDKEDLQWA
jgi:hypothetical protein